MRADTQPSEGRGGFFAHKQIEQVFEQESEWTAVGTVLLWGDVVEHEQGYRAEYARIGRLEFFNSKLTDSFRAWLKSEFEMADVPAPPVEDERE